jgi:uncharacterized protein YbjT (DUF2867 family)
MRILILGASQGTGALACGVALERGHDVTAFARSPQKLALDHPKLTRRVGDFHSQASVAEAVPGHDAVIITASATSMKGFKENPHYFSSGTGYAIDAMKAAGTKRLVVLSAFGAGESIRSTSFFLKMLIRFMLKAPYADHDRQEKLVMDSGLAWVIARPTRLTNGPAQKRYEKKSGLERVPQAISRADVAEFLVDAAATDEWVGKCVSLGG